MSDAPDDDVRSIHRFVRRLIGQLLGTLRSSAAFGVGIAYLRADWWKKGPLSGLYGSEEIAWRPADTAWEQQVAAERLQIAQEDETHRLAALFRATRDLDSYALERIVAQRLSTDLSGQERTWFSSRGTEKGAYHAVAIVRFNDD